ncbi:FkbM family methyltransferase [Endozoicomonas sp.]|uniref:FkbM family methyltransferase n=1 Tax=Endozoicomonas sp. TaxID=1892382 RepID=UPI003AF4D0AB
MPFLKILKFILDHPVNNGQKIKPIMRFLRWQIGSRLVPGAVVYEWISGVKFIVRNGETGLTGNIYTGLHEFEEMSFLLHVLKSEDLFIDVGSNVGSYTLLASGVAGANSVSFEPVPSTFKRLQQNIWINNLNNKVNLINKGVASVQGHIAFTCDNDTMNHALADNETNENSILVDVTSLDAVLADQSPFLMKIDVEGYETLVLDGACEILKKDSLQAVIMELNGSGTYYGFDESAIVRLMHGYGFDTYSYDPINRKLIHMANKNSESGNTIFIRNKKMVEKRLQSANKIMVFEKAF